MKKILSTITGMLLILCVTSSISKAQLKRFSIGPFVEAGFPVGDLKETHNTGYGIGLGADIKLIGGLGVTGSVSYMRFGGKSVEMSPGVSAKYDALSAVPVRVGLKYKLPIPLLYVKVEGGAANLTGGDGTAAIFAPGIGIRVLGFDLEGKYEAWFKDGTMGFFGLKAGWNF
ncbi:MAG TPA: hypothetical protein VIM87_27385 [Chitinophaga sp.]|uniref:hypothetical protein n=1 Tax=Chitinophaga sp. TaxID=1869181 RepID=UPI002F92F03A